MCSLKTGAVGMIVAKTKTRGEGDMAVLRAHRSQYWVIFVCVFCVYCIFQKGVCSNVFFSSDCSLISIAVSYVVPIVCYIIKVLALSRYISHRSTLPTRRAIQLLLEKLKHSKMKVATTMVSLCAILMQIDTFQWYHQESRRRTRMDKMQSWLRRPWLTVEFFTYLAFLLALCMT